jgi:hypothetical protein
MWKRSTVFKDLISYSSLLSRTNCCISVLSHTSSSRFIFMKSVPLSSRQLNHGLSQKSSFVSQSLYNYTRQVPDIILTFWAAFSFSHWGWCLSISSSSFQSPHTQSSLAEIPVDLSCRPFCKHTHKNKNKFLTHFVVENGNILSMNNLFQ